MSDTPLKDLCALLWPLYRIPASEGIDRALELIAEALPSSLPLQIERYQPGQRLWTWTAPSRWVCHDATLWQIGREAPIADFFLNPLSVMACSVPVDAELSWEELAPHLAVGPETLPDALPWTFSYYEPKWGFGVSRRIYDALPRDGRYRVRIQSERDDRIGLTNGVAVIEGDRVDSEILVCVNVCHVAQCNDSLTGAIAAVELARRLVADPLPPMSRSVRILWCPETIGSIAYLATHPEVVDRTAAGVCCEMLGTEGPIVLQRSRNPKARITRIARLVLRGHISNALYRLEVPFRDPSTALNDEIVLELASPAGGKGIPTIAFTRYPYDAYHSSADTPAILGEGELLEGANVLEAIVRIAASDYVPRRTYTGPLFLSGQGLWRDWRTEPEVNAAIETILWQLEGERSVFDIWADSTPGLTYWQTRAWIEGLRERGLVEVAG